jgi:hypothetical protein
VTASPALTPEAELEWEARRAPLAAAAAFLSAALIFAGVAIQVWRIGSPDNDRETLRLLDQHRSDFFLNLGLQAASYFLLTGALFYLFRATIFRRPETPKVTLGLLFIAPVLLAVGAVLNQLSLNDIADKFVATVGDRSPHAANELAKDLIKDRNKLGAAIQQGGILCLALTFVLVSLHAMRSGLLSRFMGVLGIIVGALLILPLLPGGQSVVQLFWLVALGLLFLGRWPSGRGPAWASGEAIPWPTAAEQQARRAGGSESLDGEAADESNGAAETNGAAESNGADAQAEAPAVSGDAAPETPRPASRKRKRKKR